MINCKEVIREYYPPGTTGYKILTAHGRQVADKALKAAENVAHLNPDFEFIESSALLHDIGMFMTHIPEFGCNGNHPYICHGILGRHLLEKAGFPKHALVCERHIGTGISIGDIQDFGLPLPGRDMLPISIEEHIVCYADKFYSKSQKGAAHEKTVDEIVAGLKRYGKDKAAKFLYWVELFEPSTMRSDSSG